MAINAIFARANKRLEALFKKYKNNSSDWGITGVVSRQELKAISFGTINILSRAIKAIEQTNSLTRIKRKEVVRGIEQFKKKFIEETSDMSAIGEEYGCYMDNYGIARETTLEQAIKKGDEEIEEIIFNIDGLKSKFDTNLIHRWWNFWRDLLPIVISIASLLISIIALIAGISVEG